MFCRSCKIAANGCRLFSAMAAEFEVREQYAETAIKCCSYVMRECCDDATVQSAACMCVYNYAYRSEVGSLISAEHKVADLIRIALEKFGPIDEDFVAVGRRSLKILALPDGWRCADLS